MTSRPTVRGERLYRALLRLYPPRFRGRYADDMVEFYRDRVDGEAGVRRLARVWLSVVPDLIATAAAEWGAVALGRSSPVAPVATGAAQRPEESMSIFYQDIRFALRDMRRRAGFTAVVVATLALGIGANAAIFTVVDAVLLRPLPYAHVDRIVTLQHADPYSTISEPEFIDYKRGIPALAKLAAYNNNEATVGGADGDPARTRGSRVSQDFFGVLDARPGLGRTFAPDEFSPQSKARVTVISNALWQQQFAGDPRALGRTLKLNGADFTIVGVMPAGFAFPNERTGFWTPWRLNPDSLWTRNNHYLHLVGELAPGATVERAAAQAHALNSHWIHDFPETYFPDHPITSVVQPLRDHLFGATRPYLFALLGAVALILLIACVNVANLLLARGEARRKELAIRSALGASRARVVRQLLTESLTFALAGAFVGVALAWIGVRALVALAPSTFRD